MVMICVYINDTGIAYEQANDFFAQAAAWADRQCSSYISYHVQDVSDVSLINDFIAEYRFGDPKDALLFRLKYKLS
jgi:hypothetical protein